MTVADLPLIARWRLPVGDGHELQVQEFGRADGIPALALHGGPGSGCSPAIARPFGSAYRVICPDQRGSGGSTPAGSPLHNTTDHLLADLRRLRAVLGIERWLVVGGSWGATLAVAHAADQPDAVSGLLLRSSFLARDEDLAWFFHGAAAVQPDAWQALSDAVGRPDILATLGAWLLGDDPALQARAAQAWRSWEQVLAGQAPQPALQGAALAAQVQRLRVQAHYMLHGCWLAKRPLLARCASLPRVPTLLLHAHDDHVCRFEGAQLLRLALPHAAWMESPVGGHDPLHPALFDAASAALSHFAAHGRFVP